MCATKPASTASLFSFANPLRSTLAVAALLAFGGAAAAQTCNIEYVGGDASGPSFSWSMFPSMSADGGRVAYAYPVPPFGQAGILLLDVASGEKREVDELPDGTPMNQAIVWEHFSLSADGKRVVFISYADNTGLPMPQVFVKDLESGALLVASVAQDGTPVPGSSSTLKLGPCSISADGSRVVFTSSSPHLVPGKTTWWRDVFVRDLAAGTTTRLLGASGAEPDRPALLYPSISADGRFVAIASRASNLVPGYTTNRQHVFVYDLETGGIERVTRAWNGGQADDHSENPVISADGRYVAFVSRATNLVAGDTNGAWDVFVRDRHTGVTERVNVGPGGIQANGSSMRIPRISAGGERVLFHSNADNLVESPVTGFHLYVRDRHALTTQLVVDPPTGHSENDMAAISADGLTIAFASSMPIGPDDVYGAFKLHLKTCTLWAPRSYCPATPTSNDCQEAIAWAGTPSATAGSGFVLSTSSSMSQTAGILLYGTQGAQLSVLDDSFLCVGSPLRRSNVLSSGGSSSPFDCSGSFVFDFNAWIATGSDPTLVQGASVWAQFWSRDPGSLGGSRLSNAATFSIRP